MRFIKVFIISLLFFIPVSAFAYDQILDTGASQTTGFGISYKFSSYFKADQSFIITTSSVSLYQIRVYIRKTGTPSSPLIISLSETRNGPALASTTITAAELTTDYAQYTLNFNTSYELTEDATYHITFRQDDGDLSNEYYIGLDTANTYPNGAFTYWDDSLAWHDDTQDMPMILLGSTGGAPPASTPISVFSFWVLITLGSAFAFFMIPYIATKLVGVISKKSKYAFFRRFR